MNQGGHHRYVTAGSGGGEEQTLEGTVLTGRFSTDTMTECVMGGLDFWAAVSHFLPGAEFLALSKGLSPCKGSTSNSSLLKSCTWGFQSFPHCSLWCGHGQLSKVIAVHALGLEFRSSAHRETQAWRHTAAIPALRRQR